LPLESHFQNDLSKKTKHYIKHASQIKLHGKTLTTWVPHYYALPMTINWWKIWLDVVENKSHLDDLILNWMQFHLIWIQILKLKWIELTTIFFSFGFHMVDILIEISIELNQIGFIELFS
jgi:hypothetical protein